MISDTKDPMRYYIDTFGCQMNVRDSDEMAETLRKAGHTPAAGPGDADLILVNTCTVRQKAAHKGISAVGRYTAMKLKRPSLLVGACGCYAQEAGVRICDEVKGVDLVVGPDARHLIPALIEERRATKKPVIMTCLHGQRGGAGTGTVSPGDEDKSVRPRRADGPTALVSIMRGCDNYCAFCIVPYVRGRETSRALEDVVAEVRELAETGCREVTLLGQNVNSYGAGTGTDFTALLDTVCAVDGIARVRFTTSHPKDLSEGLARRFGELEPLMPQIHLPVQAGADAVLARMNRKYTRAGYLDKVALLRRYRPDIDITTDIIVGFPGETDADFGQTMALCREVGFGGAFSFKYSIRPGTAAAGLADDVPPAVKAARLEALQALVQEIAYAKNRALVGRTLQVLVEGPSRDPGTVCGRTPCNRVLNFSGKESPVGAIVPVSVTEALAHSLRGVTA